MTIHTQSADGKTHEFPDETPPEAVDKAMKAYAEEHKDSSSFLGQAATGFMDPIEGGGQLISNIIPKQAERFLTETNNAIADKTGLLRKLPEGGKNQQMAEREAAIQKERGGSQNMDWGRMTGDVLNPINYIGAGPVGGAIRGLSGHALVKGASALASGATGGAVAGALQPVADEAHYAKDKAKEIGLGSVIGGGFGLVGGAVASGLQGLGSWVARNYPENLTSEAVTKILKRIKQDQKAGGPTATDAIDLVEAAKKPGPWGASPDGKPLALADVGGENIQGLAGNVARQPGDSRAVASQFLNQRDEAAAQRLSEDIAQHVSGGPTMHQATEGLLQARSMAATPAYKEAHALQNVWSPRLEEFFADPAVKTGLQRGYELERMQSLARGEPLTATQMGVDIGVDGSVKMVDKPNMRLLDMAKQGLDAMIADERNAITGRLSAKGVALNEMKTAYVKTIDDLDKTGAYRKARETWAGYSASMDALKLGRTVFSRSPEENAAEVARMSPANREFIRIGLADQLKERLMKGGFSGDESKQLLKNPWMRDQMRPLFKEKSDFDAFVEAVTTERQMFDTRFKTLGGSQTAGRLAEDGADMSMLQGGKIAAKLASGHLFSAAKNAFKLYQDIGLRPNPELNEKLAQILFTSEIPSDAARMLRGGPRAASNPMAAPASELAGMSAMMGTGAAVGGTEEFK